MKLLRSAKTTKCTDAFAESTKNNQSHSFQTEHTQKIKLGVPTLPLTNPVVAEIKHMIDLAELELGDFTYVASPWRLWSRPGVRTGRVRDRN
jgi:hypothetical protein